MRLRLIMPVLLVLAATAGAFVLTRRDSTGDAWFVLATGLAFAVVTAIAISNAGTRHSLALLAEEQAVLRRVATLVANESSPVEIFGAVTEEACRVLGSEAVGLLRFEPDGSATLVAQSDTPWDPPPLGTRFTLDGENVVAQVLRTGEVARVDDWSSSTGAVAAMANVLGIRSAVASPVVVEGALWGTIVAVTSRSTPLAPDTELRIREFTELVATAVANAEARSQLSRLADEQAALRRVAELVAKESSLPDVLRGIAEELANVLGHVEWGLSRDDGDGMATVLAASDGAPTPAGTRVPIDAGTAYGRAIMEGRAARIDDYFAEAGEMARFARKHGVHAAVSCPIVVRGSTWGAMSVGWRDPDALPSETEAVVTRFSDLIATAIANAEARAQVERLADEQAALRRVATLVAEGVPAAQLFSGVMTEVAYVFSDVDAALVASVIRFDPGPESVLVGASREYEREPLGARWAPKELYVSTRVLRTERSARVAEADLDASGGPDAEVLRLRGFHYQVGSPIIVEGSLWGAMCLNSRQELPPDTEARLEKFTDLVATAIANAESRAARAVLTEEQAALRRVATLVAESPESEELFSAVAREVASVLDVPGVVVERFEADGSQDVVGCAYDHELAGADAFMGVGVRVPLQPGTLAAAVFETHRAARLEDYSELEGMTGDAARAASVGSGCAAPIMMDGRLWGQMCVFSAQGTVLPSGTEHRLDDFVKLVATAISNYDARARLRMVADEQAALRRVATLVANDAPPAPVFEAVAAEVGDLLNANLTVLARYDGDGMATAIGSWSSSPDAIPVGTRSSIGGRNVLSVVAETGRPARLNDYEQGTGEAAEIARRYGWRSSIAAPITVEGRVWGVMLVATQREEPFPAGDEDRLALFTDLVATAVSNAEAHVAIRTAADEQGALRRVATLVAASGAPSDVFAAVTHEIALVLGAEVTLLCRADPDGAAVVVGTWSDNMAAPALGTRIPRGGTNLITTVLETGYPARIDNYEEATGAASEVARSYGLRSAVGAPILVESRLWGLVIAGTSGDESLPPDAEERLAGFTELVATAIANAQAHGDLTSLAEQQAALRRVATLVAQRVAPELVFRAVAQEAGGLLGADLSALVRLESDNTVTVMAGPPPGPHAPDERVPIDPGFVVETVRATERPARFETDDPAAEGMPEIVRRLGVRSAVASPIVVEGALWGAVILGSFGESFPPETEQRLDEFTELVATAISNATARAEVVASRARIVAAADQARRRIERNLHDGTQQRLVALGLAVRAAEANLPADRHDLRAQLSGVATGLVAAVEDLQEISRGIHPAILSKGGLAPALRTLAIRSAIPVDLEIAADVRLAEPIEVAAYFVASEALANAAKHSQASRIDVSVEQRDGLLWLSVRDDGVGGADAARGSGLIGLTDRVEALGGSLRVSSRPGDGTQIAAELPLELKLSPTTG